jgi:hypothetical protein
MNKKSYLLLATLITALIGCGSGGGISNYESNASKNIIPAPGPQWNAVVPLGVPIIYSGVSPSSHTNNVNIIYDTANGILYAQHVNANLYPVLLDRTLSPYWQESNPFESQLVNNSITVTSYLGADSSGQIYGFGLQANTPVLFNFNDNTQSLTISPLSGAYPNSTQFGNLYYYNGSVYAIAQTQSGTVYSYSLVQFDATSGAYQTTIDLNYTSTAPFVNIYSLPANNSMPFTIKYYLSAALGDGIFYINNNGVVTAIPLATPAHHTQVGAAFISASIMWSLEETPPWAEMSAIAYSRGRLFACGSIPENSKYYMTWAILGIASSANSNQSWESIGYTGFVTTPINRKIIDYHGCMNISAYGNKVFANNNSESDTANLFPYTAMVYESTVQ